MNPDLDTAIAKARQNRLNQGLLTLSDWTSARAQKNHNEQTSLSILKRKVAELEDAVNRAGWAASNSPPTVL